MQGVQKDIIRFSLDYNIVKIDTYTGYKGDLVVKIAVKDKEAVLAIRRYAIDLGIKEVVIKENKDVVQFEIYCITEDEGAYHIKEAKALDEVHTKHITDVWNKQE